MAYMRSGLRTRSAIRPPATLPMAMPPKNPVRIAEMAWVVLPKTSTSWRAQTTSYTRPAKPDSTKISRIIRLAAAGLAPAFGCTLATYSMSSLVGASRAGMPPGEESSRAMSLESAPGLALGGTG